MKVRRIRRPPSPRRDLGRERHYGRCARRAPERPLQSSTRRMHPCAGGVGGAGWMGACSMQRHRIPRVYAVGRHYAARYTREPGGGGGQPEGSCRYGVFSVTSRSAGPLNKDRSLWRAGVGVQEGDHERGTCCSLTTQVWWAPTVERGSEHPTPATPNANWSIHNRGVALDGGASPTSTHWKGC
jgi:hypothetical protein